MTKALMRVLLPSVDLGPLALIAVLAASLTLNVRLGLTARAQPPVFVETGFRAGTWIPSVTVSAPGEQKRLLTFDRNTLLYIFSPSCEWSRADYQNLQTILKVAGTNYDVLGIYARPHTSDADVSAYLTTHPFPGEVLGVDLTTPMVAGDTAQRFSSTPQLLVISRGGLIRRAWSGALFDDRQEEAEGYFGVRLPGAHLVAGVAPPDASGLPAR